MEYEYASYFPKTSCMLWLFQCMIGDFNFFVLFPSVIMKLILFVFSFAPNFILLMVTNGQHLLSVFCD